MKRVLSEAKNLRLVKPANEIVREVGDIREKRFFSRDPLSPKAIICLMARLQNDIATGRHKSTLIIYNKLGIPPLYNPKLAF